MLTGEHRIARKNTCPEAILYTRNPIRTALRAKLGVLQNGYLKYEKVVGGTRLDMFVDRRWV